MQKMCGDHTPSNLLLTTPALEFYFQPDFMAISRANSLLSWNSQNIGIDGWKTTMKNKQIDGWKKWYVGKVSLFIVKTLDSLGKKFPYKEGGFKNILPISRFFTWITYILTW